MLDTVDFERFVRTVDPLLKAGRDVVWVLAGRTESNLNKIKKILHRQKRNVDVLYLCYNTKHTAQFGHWGKQRGIANSKSI